MESSKYISIFQISHISALELQTKIMEEALKLSINVAICIVSPQGLTVSIINMDYSPFHSQEFARDKARAAASKKIPTGQDNPLCQLKGGFPILISKAENPENMSIGGVGISAGTQEQDSQIAIESLRALKYIIPAHWKVYTRK